MIRNLEPGIPEKALRHPGPERKTCSLRFGVLRSSFVLFFFLFLLLLVCLIPQRNQKIQFCRFRRDVFFSGLFAISGSSGKASGGDFGRVLTCFPASFRTIFRSQFPEKIVEHPFKLLLKPFKGP